MVSVSAATEAPPGTDTGPGIEPEATRWQASWLRVAIALVMAGQGMAFSLAANQTPPDTPGAFWVLHGGLAASALIVLVLLGGPLLRECFAALRAGRLTVDLLFLVSLSGAFGASLVSTVRGAGPIFYELVAILLAIYTVGKLLGARSRARALRAVEALRAEYATCVRLGPDDRRERVPVEIVAAGDRVIVAAGETVAVDGVICSGRGLVLTTPLTGEPDPTLRGPGDTVFAGMQSVDGVLIVEVTAAEGARRLDAMLREIEQARLAPARLQASVDRIAARFVPVVVLVSAGTFAFWFSRGTLIAAVENSLAVLVVACPCALGLATPLGIWSAVVRLGRLGIVARSGDFVEALATADAALFDKTGTLCEPELRVTRFALLPSSPVPEQELREVVAVAESAVTHPVAEALRRGIAAPLDGTRNWTLVEARVVPGAGIIARVQNTARRRTLIISAGTAGLMVDLGVTGIDAGANIPTVARAGLRRVWIAVDQAAAAEIELREQPRALVDKLFADLRALDLSIEIVTGDHALAPDAWPSVRRFVGLTPEQKAAYVRHLQATGTRVLFIGDGLNDAPALAAADVAIAIRQGAELARSNALAVVGGENLGTLPAAVRLTRAVRTAIRSNLRFAVVYNSGAMVLAAAGWVHPVLAALLMAGSSAIVSTRVLRAVGAKSR